MPTRPTPLVLILAMLSLAALMMVGCGGKYRTYRVEGEVTDAEGRPLAGLQLTWECDQPPLSVTAISDAQGRYRLGTVGAGDGAPPGTYRIVVTEPLADDPDAPLSQRIDPRYAAFETSGLTFTVEAQANRFDLRLDPPPGAQGPP
jgi:hypothetical protein